MNAIVTRVRVRRSITSKLTSLMAFASGVALLLACVAFAANDISMLRKNKVRELSSVAQVIAANGSAALAFQQKQAVEDLLVSSFASRPDITEAVVFDEDGTVFASYATAGKPAGQSQVPDFVGHRFSKGMLELVIPIVEDEEELGQIALKATVGDLRDEMLSYLGIATGVMMASLLVATVVGARLQRFISDPLVSLAGTVKGVKEDGDYSVRVQKPTDDEIGELYDEFNAMLARIETADAALHRAHEELRETNTELEDRVRLRTKELSCANNELQFSENRVRAIVDSASDGIFTFDQSRIIQTANAATDRIFARDSGELIGESAHILWPEEVAAEYEQLVAECVQTGVGTFLGERREVEGLRSDGSSFPMELTVCATTLHNQFVFTAFVRDLTQLHEAQSQLAHMNEQLIEASRRAGMAEVANGVLHNVGNVLNSVNVAAAMIGEALRGSEVNDLNRVLALVAQHHGDLGTFLTEHERGKFVPQYLVEAGKTLADEHETVLQRLDSLTKNIDHIKHIVATQQSYAGMSGVEQVVAIEELIEDALQINSGAFERHQIDVIREYAKLPPISIDKQKVLQILINLIGNAKHAIRDGGQTDGRVHLRLVKDGGWFSIAVTDNGIGIEPENLDRIFRHGFTTKQDGHGFGLHSAALAAKEMRGTLSVFSDGAGTGSTFTLTLPLKQHKASA